MKIRYTDKNFRADTLKIISDANDIIEEYSLDGMDLTVRQLYYQFVARDIIPESWIDLDTGSKNNPKSYGKISKIISNGRLSGLISWTSIVDKTRNLNSNSHWSSPGSILRSAANSFRTDKWKNQEHRVEVWIEKEALIGVIGKTCRDLDVPYFACKGYISLSEMWAASQRIIGYQLEGKTAVIIHLGDHDPSGIDMTRDIKDRQNLFVCHEYHDSPTVIRIALNKNQIDRYNPPPNPTKMTDTRAKGYSVEHGNESWELDALEPRVIKELINSSVLEFRDKDTYESDMIEEKRCVDVLERVSTEWRNFL